MTAMLLIDLPLTPEAPVAWLHWDNGNVIAEGVLANSSELASLADKAAGLPCYVIIPGKRLARIALCYQKAGELVCLRSRFS